MDTQLKVNMDTLYNLRVRFQNDQILSFSKIKEPGFCYSFMNNLETF